MEFSRDSLDDVLIDLYKHLLESGKNNSGTRGRTLETLAVALQVAKPRTRLSRSFDRGKPFSALGEFLWYFTRSDELEYVRPYIKRYEKEATDGHIYGAYGPRLFSMHGRYNQIENVIALLKRKPTSRRAVVQLFDAADIADYHKEIPCTTALQFHIRESALHMSVTLRSNDAYWGLPHDIFCFTMLQELIACRLQVSLGAYYHYAGSMHIYEDCIEGARKYISEGYQRVTEMPPMPAGDPFPSVEKLLELEATIRKNAPIDADAVGLEPYWADLVRLLQVFWATRPERIDELKAEFFHQTYRAYLDDRRETKSGTAGKTVA